MTMPEGSGIKDGLGTCVHTWTGWSCWFGGPRKGRVCTLCSVVEIREFTLGQVVTCNGGHRAGIMEFPTWAPGMALVRFDRGDAMVGIRDLEPV